MLQPREEMTVVMFRHDQKYTARTLVGRIEFYATIFSSSMHHAPDIGIDDLQRSYRTNIGASPSVCLALLSTTFFQPQINLSLPPQQLKKVATPATTADIENTTKIPVWYPSTSARKSP